MISIKRIKQVEDLKAFKSSGFDYVFHGKNVDERSAFSKERLFPDAGEIVEAVFDYDSFSLTLNSTKLSVSKLDGWFSSIKGRNILLDITTLDFPEMLYILHWLNKCDNENTLNSVYIEPQEYKKDKDSSPDFEGYKLSESGQSFTGLPLYSALTSGVNSDRSSLIAFMGFEGSRLGQIIESDDGATYKNLIACLGVPATKPGWENHSIIHHARFLDSTITRLEYYSCKNAYSNVRLLDDIFYDQKNITIAALGTKPSSLACAVFLVNNFPGNTKTKSVSAIHDYPKPALGRSSGVGCIYCYELAIER